MKFNLSATIKASIILSGMDFATNSNNDYYPRHWAFGLNMLLEAYYV